MDGTPVLVEGLLSDFFAEFENVRGRRPKRVYVTQGEYKALMDGSEFRLTAFAQRLDPNQHWMFDGAWIRRSKVAERIRAWDLTPF